MFVIEAKRYTDYPDELKEIELSKEDQALSPEEKMQRASVMVHDEEYACESNRGRYYRPVRKAWNHVVDRRC